MAARMGSPLVLGVADGSFCVASDTPALLSHATQGGLSWRCGAGTGQPSMDSKSGHSTGLLSLPEWNCSTSDSTRSNSGSFPHYMLKEIFDQPAINREHAQRPDPLRHWQCSSRWPRPESRRDSEHRADHPCRMRHQLARRPDRGKLSVRGDSPHPGRGRVCQRTALSQPGCAPRARPCDLHQPIGRDSRHARSLARGEAPRAAGPLASSTL